MATTANDITANALSAEGETSAALVLSSHSLKRYKSPFALLKS